MGVEAKYQWIPLQGVLRYDPGSSHVSRKARQVLGANGLKKVRERQLIVELKSRDLCRLYIWFYERRYWVKLQENMMLPHVNVLRRQETSFPLLPGAWKRHEGEVVQLEYSPILEHHWKFHVLPVRSERLNAIRVELGLGQRQGMHITIGRDPRDPD